MTASADIVTDTRDNAISIPIQSVTVRTLAQLTEKDEFKKQNYKAAKDGFVEVVFVEKNGTVTAKSVTTGIQSNDLIEITAGLKLGETVVSGSYRAISRDLSNGEAVSIKSKDENNSGDK